MECSIILIYFFLYRQSLCQFNLIGFQALHTTMLHDNRESLSLFHIRILLTYIQVSYVFLFKLSWRHPESMSVKKSMRWKYTPVYIPGSSKSPFTLGQTAANPLGSLFNHPRHTRVEPQTEKTFQLRADIIDQVIFTISHKERIN